MPHTWDGSQWIRDYTVIDGGYLETGTVTANKLDVDDLAAVSANINGKLTMGANGEITNADNDYSITDIGFQVIGTTGANEKSYSFADENGNYLGNINAASNYITVLGNDYGVQLITASGASNGVLIQTSGAGQNVTINAEEYVVMNGLPITNPGSSGRIWNDGGTLKIT